MTGCPGPECSVPEIGPLSWPKDGLTHDAFLGGRLLICQPRDGYRASADPVLLAAACAAEPGQSVLELGCGAGVASLCLAARVPGLVLHGLELQSGYAELARWNASRNGFAMTVHDGDLTGVPAALRIGFDHVIANPPYFAPQGGTPARDPGRETAQREATPLASWITAARKRLHPGGWLTMINAADRLPDILTALSAGFGSTTVLPLAPRCGRPASRVLLRSRKGGRGAFRLLAPLILHAGTAHDGDRDSYTPEVAEILRAGGRISAFG